MQSLGTTFYSLFQVRFVCISDTHSQVENAKDLPFTIPDGDVFLHAGDFTEWGEIGKVIEFNEWLGTLPHQHKVVIAGNHDLSFDPAASAVGTEYRSRIEHPDLDKVCVCARARTGGNPNKTPKSSTFLF
jgi:predicted phosphodiesterase